MKRVSIDNYYGYVSDVLTTLTLTCSIEDKFSRSKCIADELTPSTLNLFAVVRTKSAANRDEPIKKSHMIKYDTNSMIPSSSCDRFHKLFIIDKLLPQTNIELPILGACTSLLTMKLENLP